MQHLAQRVVGAALAAALASGAFVDSAAAEGEPAQEEAPSASPEPAAEHVQPPRRRGNLIKTAFVTSALAEIVFPDLRWEKGDESGLLVTWPVVGTFWAGERLGLGVGLEPQYSVPAKAWRGAGFAQVAYFLSDEPGFGLYTQTGYLIGQDGDGPFTSLGIAYGAAYAFHWALFSRVGTYDGDTRFEVGIDLQVQWLWILLSG
jgi:hypothetical protein